MTAELLNYLVLCPREHRADICTRVLRVVDRFSPDDRWRVDTLITMLTIAGRECEVNVQSSTVVYVSRSSEDLRAYSTHKLLKAIRDDDGSQRGLLNVGIWCIGEYADLLLKPYSYTPPSSSGNVAEVAELGAMSANEQPVTVSIMALEPHAVVDIVEGVVTRHTCPLEVKQRALTCFAKMRERYTDIADTATLEKLQKLVEKHEGSSSLELQLRSCEYTALINAIRGVSVKRAVENGGGEEDIFGGGAAAGGSENVSATVISAAKEALARMPVVDVKLMQRKREERSGAMMEGDMMDPFDNAVADDGGVAAVPAPAASGGEPSLLDLDDIFGGGAAPAPAAPAAAKQNGNAAAAPAPSSDIDLLSDIFSAPPVTAPVAPAAPAGGFDIFGGAPTPVAQQPVAALNTNNMFAPTPMAAAPVTNAIDPFGAAPAPPAQLQQPVAPAAASVGGSAPSEVTVQAFTHRGLTVEFKCTKPDTWNKQNSVLVARFINATDAPLYGLHLQVAVPKYVTMDMKPPTSTTVPVTGGQGREVTQTVSVTNTMLGTKNLMLKLKASFTTKGEKVEHMTTCSGFPAGQY